jgi:hypothetical protein
MRIKKLEAGASVVLFRTPIASWLYSAFVVVPLLL